MLKAFKALRFINVESMGWTHNLLTRRELGAGAKLHPLSYSLIIPVPVGVSRCALTYSSGHPIRTLWWFTHLKTRSGYPGDL